MKIAKPLFFGGGGEVWNFVTAVLLILSSKIGENIYATKLQKLDFKKNQLNKAVQNTRSFISALFLMDQNSIS